MLDQSEDYRRWFSLTHMPLNAPLRWREFIAKSAINFDESDELQEIDEATAPWTVRLRQRRNG